MTPAKVAAKSALRRSRNWLPRTFHPAQLVAFSFAVVIMIATVLLSLPAASRTGQPIPFIDALFTATSATCVTGLVTLDIGTRFTLFGQIVILCCIQIGGLGLMAFTTVFSVALGRRLAIADRIAIQESFHHSPTGNLATLILYIVISTVITEAIGAVALAIWWSRTGVFDSFGSAVYPAIFHSISAFCNAGISLFSDGLVRLDNDPFSLGVFSALIIAGGLGFLVGLDVKEYIQQKYFAFLWSPRVRERVQAIRPRPRVSLHTKLVLAVTAALLVVGAVSYYGLERGGVLRDMTVGQAILNSWFCSVTARTAGFNSVDSGRFGGPALLCTMVLMFIGASPGSTGGGVKTSTFGVLIVYAMYRWRGHGVPHVFRRSIPAEAIDRATSVVVAAVAVVIVASSFLMGFEARNADPAAARRGFFR